MLAAVRRLASLTVDWTRARRVKQEIHYACHRGLDSQALAYEVRRLVGKVVPFDLSCWHPTDPATGIIAGGIFEIPPALTARVNEIEFFEDDFNSLAELARRGRPVGILREETGGAPERSARYREILRPLGLEEELRAVFVTRSGTWAAAGLFRERGGPAFDAEEVRFVIGINSMVAEGFRTAPEASTHQRRYAVMRAHHSEPRRRCRRPARTVAGPRRPVVSPTRQRRAPGGTGPARPPGRNATRSLHPGRVAGRTSVAGR